MKRILVIVFGIFLCVSAFSADYYLDYVDNSSVGLNGTDYNCSSSIYGQSVPASLGTIATLTIDARCRANETNRASIGHGPVDGVYFIYSFDKTNWIQVSLDAAGNYIQNESTRKRAYSKDDINIDLSGFDVGDSGTVYMYYKATGGTKTAIDPEDTTSSNYYTAGFTKTAAVFFTDGSAFSPSITVGNEDELIGRFQLEADVTGASLTGASIYLDGTRSGFSNFILWKSTDGQLDIGSDEYIRTVSSDPGASALVYSSFSVTIPTSGSYILLTADVASDATGSVQGVIEEASDLTISDGEISATISNAMMSNGGAEIPTSIELTSFTAEAVMGKVELTWITESETENAHFLIYRDDEVIAQIEGAGTTTEQHSYTYLDTRVQCGIHSYAIADVSFGGIETRQAPVNVELESNDIEAKFVLNKAYPNPFNPRTAISYSIFAEASMDGQLLVDLSIYNTNGEKVANLYNGEQVAGQHQLLWDARGMASGIYVVKLMVNNAIQTNKIVLMK